MTIVLKVEDLCQIFSHFEWDILPVHYNELVICKDYGGGLLSNGQDVSLRMTLLDVRVDDPDEKRKCVSTFQM